MAGVPIPAWMSLLLQSFKDDTEMNAVFRDETWDKVKTLTDALLGIWKVSTEYQGFDANALLVSLMNKHALGQQSPPMSSLVEIDANSSYTFTNKEKFMKDMTFLIMLFGNRGSNLKKIRTKTRDDVNVIIDFLVDKYNIIHREKRGQGFDQDLEKLSVTLARITACLLLTLCSLASQQIVRVLVSFADLGAAGSNLSRAILVPHFASAIPKAIAPGAHYASFLVAVITDNIINSKSKSLTPYRAILSYYEASYRTVITTQTVRVSFLKAQGLMNNQNEWVPEFQHLQGVALGVLTNIRPDADTQNIINQLATLE